MHALITYANKAQTLLDKTRPADFLAPLLLRLYLAPVFWEAGIRKLNNFESTAAWFGNKQWGLGLPMPEVLASLAIAAEAGGAVLLFLGLGTRWISLPLMITMLIAMITVHGQNGWLAIAAGDGLFASESTQAAAERLARAKDILQEHGHYDWLTEHGNFVVLNNGIEFAATYFIMLLALFFIGGGKYVSMDYFLGGFFKPHKPANP
jgi:uncharacterized membrane protein YphA (DoxX/SURF4 family)